MPGLKANGRKKDTSQVEWGYGLENCIILVPKLETRAPGGRSGLRE